jgi:WD40 repeat protein
MRTFSLKRGVCSLAYSPDGTALWVGDSVGRVHLWDLATDSSRVVLEVSGRLTSAVYNLCLSADGGLLAVASYGWVSLYDLAAQAEQSPPESFPPAVHASLSADGNLLAVTDPNGNLVVWDRRQQQARLLGANRGFASALAFAPCGSLLAVGYLDQDEVVLFDPRTGQELTAFPAGNQEEVLSFSPDGARLASVRGNEAILWDTQTWMQRAKIRAGRPFVRCLTFHPSGNLLATAGDTPNISLWDAEGRSRGKFDWQVGKVQALAFAPDGMTAAAGGSSGRIVVWDVEEGAG